MNCYTFIGFFVSCFAFVGLIAIRNYRRAVAFERVCWTPDSCNQARAKGHKLLVCSACLDRGGK